MQNLKLLIGVIGGTLVLVFGIAFLFSSNEDSSSEPTVADSNLTEADRRHVYVAAATEEAEPSETEEATDSVEPEAELVTIVEFSDLQCPACRTAETTVNKVMADNPGKIELVYRHFPLEQLHPYAREAAIASEIVAEQGLFFEYKQLLFETQTDWAASEDPTPMFIDYAQQVGADVTDFETKLEDKAYSDLVEADVRDGFALGVNSTPTFYVNGEKLSNVGALSAAVSDRL